MVKAEPGLQDTRQCIPYDDIHLGLLNLIGGKNAHLGEVRNAVRLRTPDGFAITVQEFQTFMEENDLWRKVEETLAALGAKELADSNEYDQTIADLFDGARVPKKTIKAIQKQITDMYKRVGARPLLAVRSSAVVEDKVGQSYAGQFLSILNCKSDDVVQAYKKVLASQFEYSTIAYSEETPGEVSSLIPREMSVGVQEMIPARVAGVIYTVDPAGSMDYMVVSAVWGLSADSVQGKENSDSYWIMRVNPSEVSERHIGKRINSDNGETEPGEPCLNEEQLIHLAELALTLERFFQRPVDIEWCLDDADNICILQCRPLHLPPQGQDRSASLRAAIQDAPVLMKLKGDVAHRGIAAGKVWLVNEEDDPQSFPLGAIAVSQYTSPRLAAIVRRAAAIITDIGSSTGHMATIAREFFVPAIVGTGNATDILKTGMEVTVDAEECIVYQGIISELLEYNLCSDDAFREKKEYRILRSVLKRMTPLYLIDPRDPDFVARNCKSYHDLIRFSHEKAMQYLIELNPRSRRFRGIMAHRLTLSIPLGLSVIDIGGGLDYSDSETSSSSLEAVRSLPMKAVLAGLTAPGVWSTKPVNLGLNDFMSSLTRSSLMEQSRDYQGQNLAVLAKNYMNLSLRLGYHFNVVDTYLSDDVNDNYVYFRFVGGVTKDDRRNRRVRLLKKILESMDFWVAVTGDLIIARINKWAPSDQLRILVTLGRLIGFTRQLDTQLLHESDIDTFFKQFIKLDEALNQLEQPKFLNYQEQEVNDA